MLFSVMSALNQVFTTIGIYVVAQYFAGACGRFDERRAARKARVS